MSKKVPSLPVMLLLEVPMTICAILALALTVFLAVLGILALIFIWSAKKFASWEMIAAMWKPWWMHWRVWGWSWGVLTDPEHNPNDLDVLAMAYTNKHKKEKVAKRGYSRPSYDYPSVDLGEVFAGIVLALDFGYIGLCLIWVVVCLCTAEAVHVIKTNYHVKATPVAPIKRPAYRPSEIQVQEQDFGPFFDQNEVTSFRSKAGINNLALISDVGEVRYSKQWTIDPKDKAWRPSMSPYVTESEVKGTAVTFTDDRQNTFHLNTGQPFQFENKATLVFMYRPDGSLVQANRDRVKKANVSTSRSNAKPNPDLSIL